MTDWHINQPFIEDAVYTMSEYNYNTTISDVMTEEEMEGLMNARLEEQYEEESMVGTLMVNFVYWHTSYDDEEWGIPENECEYFFSLPTETQMTLLNAHGKYNYPEVVLAPACNI